MNDFNSLWDTLVNNWGVLNKRGYPMLYTEDGSYLIIQMLFSNNGPCEMRDFVSGSNPTEAVVKAINLLIEECDMVLERANKQLEEYNKTIEHYVSIRNNLIVSKF